MEMKKKGVFFTFIALFVIILIVAVMTTKDKYRYRERGDAIASRVRTMNNFIDDFEKDLDRELFIGGYRALISMNSYVRIIQGYVPNFNEVFKEILVNGTANGTTMDLMVQEGQKASIKGWLERINEESSALNINTEINVHELTTRHTSPWNVEVKLNATVNITDIKGTASWVYDREYSREFSILGFEDPLYTVNTADKITNLVNMTPSMDFVDASNDTTVLETHVLNSYYINSTSAPSFLMRFSGNFSPSEFGIESMVNLQKVSAQGILVKTRSIIDYLYFGNQTITGPGQDYCNFTDMTTEVKDWFRVDDTSNHLVIYEVEGLPSSSC